jgi:hypothetical protein
MISVFHSTGSHILKKQSGSNPSISALVIRAHCQLWRSMVRPYTMRQPASFNNKHGLQHVGIWVVRRAYLLAPLLELQSL